VAARPPLSPKPGIVLRLDRMNRIRSLSPVEETITVDAGCILSDIQAAAAEAGLLFPLSLGAEGSCQIGGNISTNAGGISVVRYGTMRQLVWGWKSFFRTGQCSTACAACGKTMPATI
jgi:FAD/FMN-containing dehydrogenase